MAPPLVADLLVADRETASDRLELLGPDRARFLNGLVTAAVKELAPGQGTFGFFTSRKGSLLSDFALLATEDSFWLELPQGRAETLRGHLDHYRLADRVTIAPLGWAPLAVVGEAAGGALAELFGEVPEQPWNHRAVEFEGRPGRLQNRPLLGAPAWQLWLPEPAAPALGALASSLGARPATEQELERLRISAGVPRWGLDYGEDHLPQETGLEAAISYTKGCYLGQEIVARIHYRGGVQRRLVGLRLDGPAESGAALTFEGRPVGSLGSVSFDAGGESRGLAIVHVRGAEPGARLSFPDGSTAEVVPLPFDAPRSPKEGT